MTDIYPLTEPNFPPKYIVYSLPASISTMWQEGYHNTLRNRYYGQLRHRYSFKSLYPSYSRERSCTRLPYLSFNASTAFFPAASLSRQQPIRSYRARDGKAFCKLQTEFRTRLSPFTNCGKTGLKDRKSMNLQSPNQKIPDRKTKCVIKTHINIKQNVIFSAKLKPV